MIVSIYRVATKAIVFALVAAALIYFSIMATDEKLREDLRDATKRVAVAVQKNDRDALLKVLALTDQADLLLEYKDDLKSGYFVSVHRKGEEGVTLSDFTGTSYRGRIRSNEAPVALEVEYNRWTTRITLVKCTVRPKAPPDKLANR